MSTLLEARLETAEKLLESIKKEIDEEKKKVSLYSWGHFRDNSGYSVQIISCNHGITDRGESFTVFIGRVDPTRVRDVYCLYNADGSVNSNCDASTKEKLKLVKPIWPDEESDCHNSFQD